MKNSASACGKIILSGEYAVVFGYPGIAIPAPLSLQATFEQTQIHPIEIIWPEVEGTDWTLYLKKIIDLCIEHGAPDAGTLTIQNSIPIGRGMGSSTALVIAVTRCLLQTCHTERSRSATQKRSDSSLDSARDDTIKQIALSIEDTLNPGHSGLDFDVIWNECPILFRKGEPSKPITVPINQLIDTPNEFSLIDTGKPDQTTPELVAWVKEKVCHPERIFLTMTPKQALQTIGHCTERLLAGESPLTVFPDHHRAQVALGVVPIKVQELIAEIEKMGGAAKVIGAGGATWAATRPLRGDSSGGGGMVLTCGSVEKISHLPNILKHPINQTAIHLFALRDSTQHQPTLKL